MAKRIISDFGVGYVVGCLTWGFMILVLGSIKWYTPLLSAIFYVLFLVMGNLIERCKKS